MGREKGGKREAEGRRREAMKGGEGRELGGKREETEGGEGRKRREAKGGDGGRKREEDREAEADCGSRRQGRRTAAEADRASEQATTRNLAETRPRRREVERRRRGLANLGRGRGEEPSAAEAMSPPEGGLRRETNARYEQPRRDGGGEAAFSPEGGQADRREAVPTGARGGRTKEADET